METKEDPNAKEPLKELILIPVALHEGNLFLVPPKAPTQRRAPSCRGSSETKANP